MSADQPELRRLLFLIPGCATTVSKQVPVCRKWYKDLLSAMLFIVKRSWGFVNDIILSFTEHVN